MSEAELILRLIETVDPTDTAKLDEIDALVFCYVRGARFLSGPSIELSNKWQTIYTQHQVWYINSGQDEPSMSYGDGFPYYTRSRDALKAIRPEGWSIEIIQHYGLNGWRVDIANDEKCFVYIGVKQTEELAELHAIIQAIAYKRKDANHSG